MNGHNNKMELHMKNIMSEYENKPCLRMQANKIQ